jgi:hypothetical protein
MVSLEMKGGPNRPTLATAAVVVALVVAAALSASRLAYAQSMTLTVSPIAPEGGSGAPGQTLPDGVFAVINNLPFTATISSITITFSDPSLFSSATLTGPNGASALSNPLNSFQVSDSNRPPPASSKHPPASTTFGFSPPVVIGPGGRPFFALTVKVAPSQSRDEHGSVAYASMTPGAPARGAGVPLWMAFAMLGVAMATLPAGTRRQAWLLAAVMILLAAGTSSCGGDSSNPSSTQTVTAVTAEIETSAFVTAVGSHAPPAGLPLKLGTVTLQ